MKLSGRFGKFILPFSFLVASFIPFNVSAKEPAKLVEKRVVEEVTCNSGIDYLTMFNDEANSISRESENLERMVAISEVDRMFTTESKSIYLPRANDEKGDITGDFLRDVYITSIKQCFEGNKKIREFKEDIKELTELNFYVKDNQIDIERSNSEESVKRRSGLKLGFTPRKVSKFYAELRNHILGEVTSEVYTDREARFLYERNLLLGFYGKAESKTDNFRRLPDNVRLAIIKTLHFSSRIPFIGKIDSSIDSSVKYNQDFGSNTKRWSINSRLAVPFD